MTEYDDSRSFISSKWLLDLSKEQELFIGCNLVDAVRNIVKTVNLLQNFFWKEI